METLVLPKRITIISFFMNGYDCKPSAFNFVAPAYDRTMVRHTTVQWYGENFEILHFFQPITKQKTSWKFIPQWSTCPLAFDSWLLDHVIYLNLDGGKWLNRSKAMQSPTRLVVFGDRGAITSGPPPFVITFFWNTMHLCSTPLLFWTSHRI